MKYLPIAAIALLAGCAATSNGDYEVYSLQDAAATLRPPEPSLPSGFTSIMEQQADGTWIVRNDPALIQ